MHQNFIHAFQPPAFTSDDFKRLTSLHGFPDITAIAVQHHAQQIGHAGECLHDSLLIRRGERLVPAPTGAPFDRVIFRPSAIVRIQVKTCATSSTDGSFRFRMQKGFRHSGSGTKPYLDGDFDLAALVCLSENIVFFTTSACANIRIPAARIPQLRANPYDSFDTAMSALGIAPLHDPDRPAQSASDQHPL